MTLDAFLTLAKHVSPCVASVRHLGASCLKLYFQNLGFCCTVLFEPTQRAAVCVSQLDVTDRAVCCVSHVQPDHTLFIALIMAFHPLLSSISWHFTPPPINSYSLSLLDGLSPLQHLIFSLAFTPFLCFPQSLVTAFLTSFVPCQIQYMIDFSIDCSPLSCAGILEPGT